MDIHTIKEQLKRTAECHKEIIALYLFGSVVIKAHPEDIDIAVLADEKQIGPGRYPLQYVGSLTSDLVDAVQSDDVDLVLLNNASPVLCMQVLRNGTLVFERDRRAVAAFMVRTMGTYHDLKMIRRPIERQILKGRIYG